MNDMNDARLNPRLIVIALLMALLAGAKVSRAAQDDEMQLRGDLEEEDRVPTAARRAATWRPSREGSAEPWYLSVAPGIAFFSGDDVDADPGFFVEARLSRDLTEDVYVVGAYLFTGAGTETPDPLGGSDDSETHYLHVPTIGVGLRAELNPEIHLFIEPRIGAVLTDDGDAGPAGGAAAGVTIELDPGISVIVGFTGLVTDTTLETDAGDADLDAIWLVGVGLMFEF
jgi:hypothetical protein